MWIWFNNVLIMLALSIIFSSLKKQNQKQFQSWFKMKTLLWLGLLTKCIRGYLVYRYYICTYFHSIWSRLNSLISWRQLGGKVWVRSFIKRPIDIIICSDSDKLIGFIKSLWRPATHNWQGSEYHPIQEISIQATDWRN